MSVAISVLWEDSAKKSMINIRIESNSKKEKYGVKLAFSAHRILFKLLVSFILLNNCRKNNAVII